MPPAIRAAERGAAAVFAAVSLVAGVLALALAVDVGRLYFAQRDLQRVANLAALDAARIASGCSGIPRNRQQAAEEEVAASLHRNATRPERMSVLNVALGQRRTDAEGIRQFEPAPASEAAAVHVRLSAAAPDRLVPALTGDAGLRLQAQAAAYAGPVASFEVQPRAALQAASFNPVPPLLGYGGGTTILGPRGLAAAELRLGDVAAALGVGTPTAFLRTEIAGVDLFAALAGLLTSTTDAAVRASLRALAAGGDAARRVVPGDLLQVPSGFEDAAAAALIDVGQLVLATAQATNRSAAIDLPVAVEIPGYTQTATARVRFLDNGHAGLGPAAFDDRGRPATQAQTTRANVQAGFALPAVGNGIPVRLRLAVSGVAARAELVSLICPQMGRPQPELGFHASSDVVHLAIGEFSDAAMGRDDSMPTEVAAFTALGVPVRVLASARASIGRAENVPLRFTGPFEPDHPQRQSFGVPVGGGLSAGVDALADSLVLVVEPPSALTDPLLAPIVRPILDEVRGAIRDGLQALDEPVIEPVLSELGLMVGGAELLVHDVRTAPPSLFLR